MNEANATSVSPDVAPVNEPTTQAPTEQVAPAEAVSTENTQAPQVDLQLDEATQKYLSNQNIKGTPTEIVNELVKRNQSFRNEPKKAEQPAVADVLQEKPADAPARPIGLSDLDIANVAMIIENQYKDVKVDSQFYKDMIADGFKPIGEDGEIKLSNVSRYAAYKQKLAEADKVIQQSPTPIPSPTNTIEPNLVEPVQNMTVTAAQNIVLFSNQEKRYGRAPHPQFDEAVKFLQDNTRNN